MVEFNKNGRLASGLVRRHPTAHVSPLLFSFCLCPSLCLTEESGLSLQKKDVMSL